MNSKTLQEFLVGLLREKDGTPSSTRTLMFLLSIFSCVVIALVIHHMIKISDVGLLSAWLSSLPMIITALIGLITVPYSINKGSGMMSDIASAYVQAKSAVATIKGANATSTVNSTVIKVPDDQKG